MPRDRHAWEALFRAYIDFYGRSEPQEMYDRAWRAFQDDQLVHARGARLDDQLVGIAQFLVHASTSAADVCYLQDLFTVPEARRRGVASTLLRHVEAWALSHGCTRLYWHTQMSNHTARRLYDKVADFRGFVVYQVPLHVPGPLGSASVNDSLDA